MTSIGGLEFLVAVLLVIVATIIHPSIPLLSSLLPPTTHSPTLFASRNHKSKHYGMILWLSEGARRRTDISVKLRRRTSSAWPRRDTRSTRNLREEANVRLLSCSLDCCLFCSCSFLILFRFVFCSSTTTIRQDRWRRVQHSQQLEREVRGIWRC